jgi:hypothetical protein
MMRVLPMLGIRRRVTTCQTNDAFFFATDFVPKKWTAVDNTRKKNGTDHSSKNQQSSTRAVVEISKEAFPASISPHECGGFVFVKE